MKTNKEWLDQLPQPQRHQAINNVINQGLITMLEYNNSSLSIALISSFDWKETDESFDYWNSLHDKIMKDENN